MSGLAVQACAQLVDSSAEGRHRSGEGFQTPGQGTYLLLCLLDLLARPCGRGSDTCLDAPLHTLDRLLEPGNVAPDSHELFLRGGPRDLGHARATAEQEGRGEEKRASPRRGVSRYCALTKKWSRRFCAQHASLLSLQKGRSLP